MLKRLIAVICVYFIYLTPTLSQNDVSYTPIPAVASPNVQSLGLYGEVPVSLFSGLPQISIPIYELDMKGVTLPISATYHASGFRIEQHPSWIGIGWSLVAGGSIDRVQRGIPDEKGYLEPQENNGVLKGFFRTGSILGQSNWSNSFLMASPYVDGTDMLRKDLEPDEFRFSYPGNSGSFFLNEKREWCVRSEKPVKVLFGSVDMYPMTGTNYTFSFESVFKEFILVDGFGYKYVFGGVENAIEYSDTYFSVGKAPDHFSATSWKLTKILAPSGEELFELGYERGPTIAQLYIAAYQKAYSERSDLWGCGSSKVSWRHSPMNPERGNLISPVYLKYIKCVQKDVKLNFVTSASNEMSYIDPNADNINYAENNPYISAFVGTYKDENPHTTTDPTSIGITPGDFLQPHFLRSEVPYFQTRTVDPVYWKNILWLKLDRIEISDTDGRKIRRKVQFDYNNQANERLRLGDISFVDASNVSVSKYEFKYNDEPLGRYLSSVGDFWGFHNNGPSLPSIYLSNNLSEIETYKQPSLKHTKAGVLTEIVYPTGGSAKFEYELNTCSKVADIEFVEDFGSIVLEEYIKTVGGLRIKKIISDEPHNGTTTKEYYYVKGYTSSVDTSTLISSGILQTRPKYSSSLSISNPYSFAYSAYYSNPVIPLTDFSSGDHIGYSEVVEKRSDGFYTIKKYTNHDNGYGDEIFIGSFNGLFNYQFPVSSRSHERGKLLEETTYTNIDIPVSRVTNIYARSHEGFARSVRNGKESFCNAAPYTTYAAWVFDHYHKSAYKVFYNSLQLKSSLSRTYANNDSRQYVETLKEYKYNVDGDIAEEQLSGSTGVISKTRYLYARDFPGLEPYTTMISRYMVSPVVEQIQLENDKVLLSTKTKFGFWTGSRWSPTVADIVVPNVVETKAADQVAYEPRVQYRSYDKRANLTSVSTDGAAPTSFLWGYDGSALIARIDNCEPVSVEGESWYQTLWLVDHMISGHTYTFAETCTFPKTVSVTITREYLKATDHAASFYVYIYDANNNLVKTYYDSMNKEESSLSVSDRITMAAGTYRVKVNSSNPYGITYVQEVGLTMSAFAENPASLPFYTSFEEAEVWADTVYYKTGRKSHTGSYTVKLPPCPSSNNKYVLSYWIKHSAGSPWELVNQNTTVPSEYSTLTIGAMNKFIDEVRIYPEKGAMTTYTYDQPTGMTSSSDPRNQTTYYEYDDFQRLKQVKDANGKVLKNYDYHYKP